MGTSVGAIFDATAGSGGSGYSFPDMAFVGSTLVAWTEDFTEASGSRRYDAPLTIDTATGGATLLTSSSGVGTYNTGLAANASGDVLLLAGGLRGSLYSIDVSTGLATSTVAVDSSGATYGRSGGATFHNGQLYSLDCTRSAACSIGTIDTTTGVYTDLGITISTTGDLDAIASPSL